MGAGGGGGQSRTRAGEGHGCLGFTVFVQSQIRRAAWSVRRHHVHAGQDRTSCAAHWWLRQSTMVGSRGDEDGVVVYNLDCKYHSSNFHWCFNPLHDPKLSTIVWDQVGVGNRIPQFSEYSEY